MNLNGKASSPAAAQLDAPVARRWWALAWTILRLPIVLVVLYSFRYQIIDGLERFVDIGQVTLFVINVMGTPLMRALFFVVFALILVGAARVMGRFSLATRYYLMLAFGTAAVLVLFEATGTSKRFALPTLIVLITNLAPDEILERVVPSRRFWTRLVAIVPGIAELFFLRQYLHRVVGLVSGRATVPATARGFGWTIPGLLLVAGFTAAMVDGTRLVGAEQYARMRPEARIVARGDFNWMEIDPSGRYLYVVGHGFDHLLRYNLTDWSVPPLVSAAPAGFAQGFAYDPVGGEIFVYDEAAKNLLYFDTTTLALKRTLPIGDLSPGDPWLAFEPKSGTITIASEADERTGTPLMVLDRATGAVVDRRDEEAGNLLVHPRKPHLYMSYFRRSRSVKIFDLSKREITQQVPIRDTADRMAFWESRNELLLTLPMASRIIRMDADTLKTLGYIPTIFGVRTLAVDAAHDLLLCGSLTTGQVDVIDLRSGKRLNRYYLGPWLRTIVLQPDRNIAYISTNGAIFELRYR